MTDKVKNPLTDSIFELDDVEYELRQLTQLLSDQLNLVQDEKDLDRVDQVIFLNGLLRVQTRRVRELHDEMLEAWKTTKPIVKAFYAAQASADA